MTVGFYCVPVLGEPEYGVSVKVPAAWNGVEGQYALGMVDHLMRALARRQAI